MGFSGEGAGAGGAGEGNGMESLLSYISFRRWESERAITAEREREKTSQTTNYVEE